MQQSMEWKREFKITWLLGKAEKIITAKWDKANCIAG